jgi:hypothetical protein
MNKVLIALPLIGFLVSPLSYSADFDNCRVVEIVSAGPNNAHVNMDCAIAQRPTCAVAGTYFGFDKATEEGKQYMSMVLTAYATGSYLTGKVHDTQCSPYQGNVALLQSLRMRK